MARERPLGAAVAAGPSMLVTTFEADGTPVVAAVWGIPWGEQVAFVSPRQTSKIQRLRRDPRIAVRAGDADGVPLPGSRPVRGRASFADDATFARVCAAMRERQGAEAWDGTLTRSREHFDRLGGYEGHVAVIVTADG